MSSFGIWHWIVIGVALAWIIVGLTRRRRQPAREVSRVPLGRNATVRQLDHIEDLCLRLGRDPPEGYEAMSHAEAGSMIDRLKEDLKHEGDTR